jgi:hypothetical protein
LEQTKPHSPCPYFAHIPLPNLQVEQGTGSVYHFGTGDGLVFHFGTGDGLVFHPIGVWRAETFSRFVWRNPEKVAFVWHTKRKKTGIRHTKREKLGILPHQTTKPRIPATPNEKTQDSRHTKRILGFQTILALHVYTTQAYSVIAR